MSREAKYTAIILKKQPFGEGDEIVTFYTKENGKVRGLAKSVKSAKSKLQQRLQSLFLVELGLAGGKLPKIISAEPKKVFAGIRENLDAMKMAFYAVEVVLKSTADEEKNEQLFNLLVEFFDFLDSAQGSTLEMGLVKFKLEILSALGLAIRYPKHVDGASLVFSPLRGGFFTESSADAIKVGENIYDAFLAINNSTFKNLPKAKLQIEQLQELLSGFISYQLERKIKSEKYLNM